MRVSDAQPMLARLCCASTIAFAIDIAASSVHAASKPFWPRASRNATTLARQVEEQLARSGFRVYAELLRELDYDGFE